MIMNALLIGNKIKQCKLGKCVKLNETSTSSHKKSYFNFKLNLTILAVRKVDHLNIKTKMFDFEKHSTFLIEKINRELVIY